MGSPEIMDQDEFNKVVSQALRNLYLVAIKADSGDAEFRHDLARIDAYAFRREYASMPEPPEIPDLPPAVSD